MMSNKKLLWGVCVAALTIAPACTSSDSGSSEGSSATVGPDGDAPAVEFNDADVMFGQMMIPHHEQAIELSDIALDPQVGASESVRALAQQIKDAQDPEIDEMAALLSSWGESTSMDSSMDHSSMMSGMLTVEQLESLSELRSAEFDRAWLEAMIAHHEGAVEMAETVLTDGANPAIRSLAERIIAGQQAEIDAMRALLG